MLQVRGSSLTYPGAGHCWLQCQLPFQWQQCMYLPQSPGTHQALLFGNFSCFSWERERCGFFFLLFFFFHWFVLNVSMTLLGKKVVSHDKKKKSPKPCASSNFKPSLNIVQVMSTSIRIKQDRCANTIVPSINSYFHLQVRKSKNKQTSRLTKTIKKSAPAGVNIIHKYFISFFCFSHEVQLEKARAIEEGRMERQKVPADFRRNTKNFSRRHF